MHYCSLKVLAILALVMGVSLSVLSSPDGDFLTAEEIDKIQDAQEIERRIEIYLEAAALRLKKAAERLSGVEPQEGDELEFFTVEDMLDSYYRILRSVMLNLDDVYQKPNKDLNQFEKALKKTKKTAENAAPELESLKKTAEEQKKEQVWRLVNRAIDLTKGVQDGVEQGLSELEAAAERRRRSR